MILAQLLNHHLYQKLASQRQHDLRLHISTFLVYFYFIDFCPASGTVRSDSESST